MVLLSASLYAQDDSTIELNEDGVELNPVEVQNSDMPEDVKVSEQIEEPKSTEKIAEEEIVGPVEVPKKEEKAELVSEVEIGVGRQFKSTESHWYTIFGFEAMEYDIPFTFDGEKKDFSQDQRQLYGGRLGFGGEIYLGIGFLISTRLEGYYMGTLFEAAKTADPELEDEDIATTKDTGQIYGADIVQTLSFIWELKTKNPFMDEMTYLTVEPFVEAGIGRAWAYNQKDYSYDTTEIIEEYDQSFTDELTNTKIGGGINFTSRQGFFLYLKATQNRYDITKRTTKGYFYRDGSTRADVGSNPTKDLEPIMIYALGGGYKF